MERRSDEATERRRGGGTRDQGTKASAPAIANRKSQIANSQQRLVLDHLDLVRRIARKFHQRCSAVRDLEDIEGDGFVGLIDAARRFDPGRRVKFNTYASQRIRGAMMDGLRDSDEVSRSQRRAGNQTRIISHCEMRPIEKDSGESIDPLSRLLSREPDPSGRSMICDQVRILLRPLPRPQRMLVTLHILHGLSLRQCGRVLGYSESWCSVEFRRSMDRLRGAGSI